MKAQVILISGKLQSGKNSFADILKEEIETKYFTTVQIDYFAKLLKDMCKEAFRPLTDFLNEYFNSISYHSSKALSLVTEDLNWYETKNEITRHVLQGVGTQIVRTVNENYWIEAFKNRIREHGNLTICSDVRFENEISEVEKDFDTIKIRVERNLDRNGSINEHISEKALDNYKDWDYIIENNGTLDDLRGHAKRIVSELDF